MITGVRWVSKMGKINFSTSASLNVKKVGSGFSVAPTRDSQVNPAVLMASKAAESTS